ncbi:MAG: ribosome assembly RNA-binding protein YhbY [Halothiobacillaceae bacterium]|nr:MAG: ribosome assembly RNA-binding protein YhbY [Halothiobacillaceae bacterium]
MPLNAAQVRHLRSLAHHIKPVVLLGQHGLTESVMAEIELALEHHELIKVRVPGMDREDKQDVIEVICERTGAELVQAIGHMAVLFRKRAKDSQISLPR